MKKTIVFVISIIILLSFFRCTPAQFFPTEGIWYCSELEIQLDFQDGTNCFFVHEGEKIICGASYNRGSSLLLVSCQDADTEHFAMGELVFGGRFVSLENDNLILLEEKTGTEYCFLRIQ